MLRRSELPPGQPPKRKQGLRKTRLRKVSKKEAKKRRDGKAVLQEFAEEHLSCACCGFREGQLDGSLEIHHIAGGTYGRKHDRRNLLRLCKRWDRPGCHLLVDGASNGWPKVTLAMQLTMKAECDVENFDPVWLSATRGQALPEPEPIPEVFMRERERNLNG